MQKNQLPPSTSQMYTEEQLLTFLQKVRSLYNGEINWSDDTDHDYELRQSLLNRLQDPKTCGELLENPSCSVLIDGLLFYEIAAVECKSHYKQILKFIHSLRLSLLSLSGHSTALSVVLDYAEVVMCCNQAPDPVALQRLRELSNCVEEHKLLSEDHFQYLETFVEPWTLMMIGRELVDHDDENEDNVAHHSLSERKPVIVKLKFD
jgi:hypothetical protein